MGPNDCSHEDCYLLFDLLFLVNFLNYLIILNLAKSKQ